LPAPKDKMIRIKEYNDDVWKTKIYLANSSKLNITVSGRSKERALKNLRDAIRDKNKKAV